MARKRPVFTVETPFAEARTVTLYEEDWDNHVTLHAEMRGQIAVVEQTLIQPTYVADGNKPERYQFVNLTPSESGLAPLVVLVGYLDEDPNAAVITAFKGRKKHLDLKNFVVRWP